MVIKSNLIGEDFKIGQIAYYEQENGRKAYVKISDIVGNGTYAKIKGQYHIELQRAIDCDINKPSYGSMNAYEMFKYDNSWKTRLSQ